MKSVAIGGELLHEFSFADSVGTVRLEGIPLTVGRVETPPPTFDPALPSNRSRVLVRVRAFSCNYRDKGSILDLSRKCQGALFFFVGSDFVGDVVEVGEAVSAFKIGDRVLGNNQYPHTGSEVVRPGIASTFASQRLQALPDLKLVRLPEQMPDDVAAGFSIGAQTVYSMIRRLELRKGANILLTSARSNTSLFVINALRKYDVNLYATSRSGSFRAALETLGVREVIQVEEKVESFLDYDPIQRLVSATGGFDVVIDPFFDLHLGKAIEVMNFGARYITCGFYNQYARVDSKPGERRATPMAVVMSTAIVRNIQLIGNCLGESADLEEAIQDYASGRLKVIVDRVCCGPDVVGFFDRTYNAQDRFGKVIYRYE